MNVGLGEAGDSGRGETQRGQNQEGEPRGLVDGLD